MGLAANRAANPRLKGAPVNEFQPALPRSEPSAKMPTYEP